MKVTLSDHLHINIEGLQGPEIHALIAMIRGASLEERRIFHPVLVALTETPLDQLEHRSRA